MKIGILSGYFNPLHGGHLNMILDAKKRYDEVVVIVNNDKQQKMKKGSIIMTEQERTNIMLELKSIDLVILSVDEDRTVCKTLERIRNASGPEAELFFCNGGDQDSTTIPEAKTCLENNISLRDGIGGAKTNSSTRIHKKTFNKETAQRFWNQ